jgi:transglutaminase-like putative cysteine protease
MVKKKLNLKRLMPVIIIVLVLFLLNLPSVIENTKFVDYNNNLVQNAILWVEQNSDNDYDKIVNTAQYIDKNIDYENTGLYCLVETAERVLENGKGDCVSKTKVAVAILTGMDIPIKIIEGCFTLSVSSEDNSRQFKIPYDPNSRLPINNYLSRTSLNKGQLHSWIRAYDGDNWYTVETTAGEVFPFTYETKYGYNVYGGNVNPNKPYDLCVVSDINYVLDCKEGNLI